MHDVHRARRACRPRADRAARRRPGAGQDRLSLAALRRHRPGRQGHVQRLRALLGRGGLAAGRPQAGSHPGGQRGRAGHHAHQGPQAGRVRSGQHAGRRDPVQRRLRARALRRGPGYSDDLSDQFRRRSHSAQASQVAHPHRLLGQRQHASVRGVRGQDARLQEGRHRLARLRLRLGDGGRLPQDLRGQRRARSSSGSGSRSTCRTTRRT